MDKVQLYGLLYTDRYRVMTLISPPFSAIDTKDKTDIPNSMILVQWDEDGQLYLLEDEDVVDVMNRSVWK